LPFAHRKAGFQPIVAGQRFTCGQLTVSFASGGGIASLLDASNNGL
jgi:hypothetical protein